MVRALHHLQNALSRPLGPVTVLGRTVLLLGVLAWIGGALLGWDELLVVAAGCLLGMAVAVLFTLGRVSIDVAVAMHPNRVVVGDRAVAQVVVTNTARRRQLPVRVEVPIGPIVVGLDIPMLASGSSIESELVVSTDRRSVVAVGPIRSVRGDPLGLMRREMTWSGVHELFVHPAHSKLEGITAGWMRDIEGRATNDRSPSDLAFHALREYVPGDDQRHVHWSTSARLGKLMVREYIDNRRSHLAIVIDTNPAHFLDADEFEVAVSLAASLGLRAIRDGRATSCVGGDTAIAGRTGQTLLDGLSRIEFGVPLISLTDLAIARCAAVEGFECHCIGHRLEVHPQARHRALSADLASKGRCSACRRCWGSGRACALRPDC